jgi:hypothetical protein
MLLLLNINVKTVNNSHNYFIEYEYQCIDPQSNLQRVQIDFIDLKEKHPYDIKPNKHPQDQQLTSRTSQLKNKSLVYISYLPTN